MLYAQGDFLHSMLKDDQLSKYRSSEYYSLINKTRRAMNYINWTFVSYMYFLGVLALGSYRVSLYWDRLYPFVPYGLNILLITAGIGAAIYVALWITYQLIVIPNLANRLPWSPIIVIYCSTTMIIGFVISYRTGDSFQGLSAVAIGFSFLLFWVTIFAVHRIQQEFIIDCEDCFSRRVNVEGGLPPTEYL